MSIVEVTDYKYRYTSTEVGLFGEHARRFAVGATRAFINYRRQSRVVMNFCWLSICDNLCDFCDLWVLANITLKYTFGIWRDF